MAKWAWLTAMLLVASLPAHAGPASMAGTWAIEQCDEETPRKPCGGFSLVLVQRGNRLCGSHFAATTNYGRVDEGRPTSLIGTVVGDEAVLFVASGRDAATYLARVRLSKDQLAWKVVEKIGDGADPGAPVIALDQTLHRASADPRFAPVASACELRFNITP
jgi:hypothetical protein